MVAGLPGTGIGGCFFLLTALLMPVAEMGRTLQGRSNLARWRFVLFQSGIALGVIAAMWATGWAAARILYHAVKHTMSPAAAKAMLSGNILQTPPVIFTLLTLMSVLLGVEVLRRLFGRKTAQNALK